MRQISKNCSQSGELLLQVWIANLTHYEKAFKKQNELTSTIEIDFFNENIRIHKSYQLAFEKIIDKIKFSEEEVNFCRKDREKMIIEVNYLKKKLKKLDNAFTNTTTQLALLSAEYNSILQENLILKIQNEENNLIELNPELNETEIKDLKDEIFKKNYKMLEEEGKINNNIQAIPKKHLNLLENQEHRLEDSFSLHSEGVNTDLIVLIDKETDIEGLGEFTKNFYPDKEVEAFVITENKGMQVFVKNSSDKECQTKIKKV